MSEPLRISYTREEMIEAAREWVWNSFVERDRRHTELGVLGGFIHDHFPVENKEAS